MRILDVTASNRSMWYQKNNSFTVFLDKRCGRIYKQSENSRKHSRRTLNVFPDIIAVWQHLPIRDSSFDVVVFDPPHILKDIEEKDSILTVNYGRLCNHNWKHELGDGIKELFRVLKPDGMLVLKWNEIDVQVSEVLKLFPYKPLFGTRTGQKNNTHWITFIKHRQDSQLEAFC